MPKFTLDSYPDHNSQFQDAFDAMVRIAGIHHANTQAIARSYAVSNRSEQARFAHMEALQEDTRLANYAARAAGVRK